MALVKMPDGAVVDVPDNADPAMLAELEALVKGPTKAPQGGEVAPPGGMLGQLGRQLGLTARAGLTGLTAVPAMLGDAAAAASNMALGTKFPNQTQALQKLMTQLGLPEPENAAEDVAQFGATVLAGAGDPVSRAAQKAIAARAPLYNAPTAMDAHARAVQEAQQHGLAVTPREAHAGPVGKVMEMFAGKQGVQAHNAPVVDKLARKALGVADDAPLDGATLQKLMDDTYQQAYEPLRAIGHVPAMPGYKRAIGALTTHQGAARSFPGLGDDESAKLAKQFDVKGFQAEDALEAIKQLRKDAGGSFASGKTEMGLTQRSLANALEDNIDEFLHSPWARNSLDPKIVENFRAGRIALAKQHAVARALNETTGEVDAGRLGAMVKKKVPLTDELAVIGRAARAAPQSLRKPSGEDLVQKASNVTGVLGVLTGNAPLSALPIARAGAQVGLATPLGQKLFAQPRAISQLPPQWLRALPAGMAGLGAGLFGE